MKKNKKKKERKKVNSVAQKKIRKPPSPIKTKMPAKNQIMTTNMVPKTNRLVLSRPQGPNMVVLLDLDNDKSFFKLTHVAAEFWGLIDGKRSIKKISKQLIDKHDTGEKLFHIEVRKLLKKLQTHGLIYF